MSVQRSGNGRSYQSIEVQTLQYRAALGSGEQNSDESFRFEEEVVGPDGLDRDLVAELVYAEFYVQGRVINQDTATNTTPGAARYRVGFGINSGQADYPGQEADTVDTSEVVGSSNANADGQVGDDPGVLYNASVTVGPAFSDTAGGSGGGPMYPVDRQDTEYGELLDHGPVVDATDDLQCDMTVSHESLGGKSELVIHATLWWDVHEVEGARPQFGMPSP